MGRVGLFVASALLGAACAHHGFTDGTSVSRGSHNDGRLEDGVRLAVVGDGYRMPRTWAARGLHYGTEELVALIVRAARRVALEWPGSTLWVGDLSPARGGPSAWHRSHQNGRDVDLLFFALDDRGRPAPPPVEMIRFGPDGVSRPGITPRRYFDVARNWALVKALLEDPEVQVQYLFIYAPLERRLLDYARAQGEPIDLLQRAEAILHQPSDSAPHDDHLHVRIYCPPSDRVFGCIDHGPLRWWKKAYKYLSPRRLADLLPRIAAALSAQPFCRGMRLPPQSDRVAVAR